MTTIARDPNHREDLRSRAVQHLLGNDAQALVRVDASAALRVLYELASSPSTASDALALLHELQVHQVEVELQDEELRRSRVELETSLGRQIQLYDCAPVAQLTVDRHAVLRELNRTGAALLGLDRDYLRGQSLESFLTSESVSNLRAILERGRGGNTTEFADLQLRTAPDAAIRHVHAAICPDPDGEGFLIGMLGSMATKATPRVR
jgi:PAS domain-containing protein